jgi:hypothetical protein
METDIMRHAIKEQQPTWQLVAATAIVAGVLVASNAASAGRMPGCGRLTARVRRWADDAEGRDRCRALGHRS